MKEPAKTIIKKLVNKGIIIEYKNAEILRKNLAKARKELKNAGEKSGFLSAEYRATLEETMRIFEEETEEEFDIEGLLEQGIEEGQELGQESLTGGRSDQGDVVANFVQWKPLLPLSAISAKESEFIDLIKDLSQDLKKQNLRAIQRGLALGMSTDELSAQVLGTGLKGLKGRDGVWRKATQRAETIARTVSNDLINYGAQLTYAQMAQITPEAGFEKVWQSVSDNRTSDVCTFLNKKRAKIDAYFESPFGNYQRPPAHPNCRSRITTVAKKYEKKWDLKYANAPSRKKVKPVYPDKPDESYINWQTPINATEEPVTVNLDQVYRDHKRHGITLDLSDSNEKDRIKRLEETIKQKMIDGTQFTTPILTFAEKDNEFNIPPGYDVVDGRHRLEAFKNLGFTSIKAIVRS